MTSTPHWREFPDAEQLAAGVARRVLDVARAAIAARGVFRIVLAGGRTPLAAYARVATAESDWPAWQVYFGDERCLPRGDAGRNDTEARRVWLDRVPIPAANVHYIPAELGPEAGARGYAEVLAGVPEFDLVLLGLGEDGHTASLFPHRPPGDGDVLAVRAAPKAPPERVTLSVARLSRSRQVLFLVTGTDKRAAVREWRAGRGIVAGEITPPDGVEVWLDAQAAAGD